MRDRLIELHQEAGSEWNAYLERCFDEGEEPERTYDEFIADYLLENGVVVSPCKVGDFVWVIRKFGGNKLIDCGNVSEIIITDKPQIKVKRMGKGTIANGEFGKTVFLTVEEAEQALTCHKSRQAEKGGVEE